MLTGEMGRLYAENWEAPDLLCLNATDTNAAKRIGFGGAVGDYLVELFCTDGMEILHLTQANNGNGAFSYLLPDAEDLYEFTLTRDCGVGGRDARRRGETFSAVAVRYEGAVNRLWLQEAEIVDELPDGTPIRRAKAGAPCLAYPVFGEDVLRRLDACRDPEFPMCTFDVTVDNDGTVRKLA